MSTRAFTPVFMQSALALALSLLSVTAAPAQRSFDAMVVEVTDGDTVRVMVPAFAAVPVGSWSLRVAGIDTPERRMPPAKCALEVRRGLAASTYAHALLKPGDRIGFTWLGPDKYFRIVAAITLPDGRDFGTAMIGAGLAAPYEGGTKRNWCRR